MASKDSNDGIIDPNMGYSLERAARAMGMHKKTLENFLIKTGEIPTAQASPRTPRFIMGYFITQWIERAAKEWDESQDDE